MIVRRNAFWIHRSVVVLVLLSALLVFAVPAQAAASGSSTGLVVGDFNGDGKDDLAVGVPGDDPTGTMLAQGAVNVLYGSGSGLTATADDLWHQGIDGVPGTPHANENFGAAVAAGKFNDDRFFDLAIGAPTDQNESSGEIAGSVTVLLGSPSGLRTNGARLWTEDSPGIKGETNDGDEFGSSLAVGNLGRSRYDDLAIGAPGDILSPPSGDVTAGAVHVLYGSSGGLRKRGDQVWHQNRQGIGDTAETQDEFAASIAAANFGKTGKDDLAIGVPRENHSGVADSGQVHVIYGGRRGLRAAGDQIWRQGGALPEESEEEDVMGWSVAAGNLGKSRQADLAIGVPFEEAAGNTFAGFTMVLYGREDGLAARGSQRWTPPKLGREYGSDRFGNGLLVADLIGSDRRDLVIGSEFAVVTASTQGGRVDIVRGGDSGLRAAGSETWHQDSPGIKDTAEDFDSFGCSLAAGDFGKTGAADLAVGAPAEDIDFAGQAGVVNAIYGRRGGLSGRGDQLWHQDIPGVRGSVSGSDFFSSYERSTD